MQIRDGRKSHDAPISFDFLGDSLIPYTLLFPTKQAIYIDTYIYIYMGVGVCVCVNRLSEKQVRTLAAHDDKSTVSEDNIRHSPYTTLR